MQGVLKRFGVFYSKNVEVETGESSPLFSFSKKTMETVCIQVTSFGELIRLAKEGASVLVLGLLDDRIVKLNSRLSWNGNIVIGNYKLVPDYELRGWEWVEDWFVCVDDIPSFINTDERGRQRGIDIYGRSRPELTLTHNDLFATTGSTLHSASWSYSLPLNGMVRIGGLYAAISDGRGYILNHAMSRAQYMAYRNMTNKVTAI